jgi:hypothetical protein
MGANELAPKGPKASVAFARTTTLYVFVFTPKLQKEEPPVLATPSLPVALEAVEREKVSLQAVRLRQERPPAARFFEPYLPPVQTW